MLRLVISRLVSLAVTLLAVSLAIFLSAAYRQSYGSHQTWKPRLSKIGELLKMGIPMGLLPAGDYLGIWLFQIMQVRLSTTSGAATQIVMMLISLAFMPGMGIASAGTTLVGEAIGAGERAWARRVGSRVTTADSASPGVVAMSGAWNAAPARP